MIMVVPAPSHLVLLRRAVVLLDHLRGDDQLVVVEDRFQRVDDPAFRQSVQRSAQLTLCHRRSPLVQHKYTLSHHCALRRSPTLKTRHYLLLKQGSSRGRCLHPHLALFCCVLSRCCNPVSGGIGGVLQHSADRGWWSDQRSGGASVDQLAGG